MTDQEQINNLKEEVRVLKQVYDHANIIVNSRVLEQTLDPFLAPLARMIDQELMELIKEYNDVKFRRDNPHDRE